jgi:chromatin remodeling complex protein RSC6
MRKNNDIELEMQNNIEEHSAIEEDISLIEEASEMKEHAKKTIQKIKDKVKEEDPKLTASLNLRTILGGDFLTAEMVRKQLWLFVLMVFFTIIYVASRYQCQQDLIAIDKLEKELLDAKYKALSSSSTLTEMCRESHVLDALKQNRDTLLHISGQPPYIINVPE